MRAPSRLALCLGLALPIAASAASEVVFSSQVGSALVGATPSRIDIYASGTDPAGLRPVTLFDSLYDSGTSTDVFGNPAHGTAAVQAAVDIPAGAVKLLARADYVPNAVFPTLPAGAVFAFGGATYLDTLQFSRPGAAADSFVIGTLSLPVSATFTFQAGAPLGTALGTLGTSLAVAYTSGQHAAGGDAKILDTCTALGCSATVTNLFATADGFAATLLPRAGLAGTDLLTLAFPIWGESQTMQFNINLSASANNGVTVDALHTAVLSVQVPADVGWTSESGYLAPVPEPAPAALLAAGLAALAALRRTGPRRARRA